MESRPRPRHFLTQDRRERERVRAGRANYERPLAYRLRHAIGVDRMKRHVGHGQDRFAQVAVRSVADEANDLVATPSFRERLSYRALTIEELFRERFIDDRDARRRVARTKVSSVDEVKRHRACPA